ncbi:2-polyprenylphenol hydroxylase [Acidianus sp. HS-5]|uniref:2-polyprenylphenol hydroxylase n=1 Tax=Acidianus sp. HS-5 TaxID=2886040 RepID=UPI001F349833|nr:2-polyprenylphenol hydroxylase [Acidianus sp. HS-5]
MGKIFNIYIEVNFNPLPGQYISIILPSENEIPLGIGDYEDGVLTLFIESEKIIKKLLNKKYLLLKGPLGREIRLGRRILGIAEGNLYYDLLYPLRQAKRQSKEVKVLCKGCESEFEEPSKDEDFDTVLAAVNYNEIKYLPPEAYIYVRWVKMNCTMGVCGVCNIKGHLPCVEGPFMKVKDLVD